MRPASVLTLCSLGFLLVAELGAQPAPVRELKLGTGSGRLGDVVSVPLTMTSVPDAVQGLQALADWDGAKLSGQDLTAAPSVAGADVLVRRIQPAFMALGVVMQAQQAPSPKIIPSGTGILIASLKVKCLGPAGEVEDSAAIVFQDGKYGFKNPTTGEEGPPLDNLVVVGGLSIGKREGLVLTNGNVRCLPAPIGTLTIQATTGQFGNVAKVPVVLGNQSPVQALVLAIKHQAGITLQDIEVGPAASAADFVDVDRFADGGTLGVVMDLFEPFTGATIGAGANNVVARYVYGSALRECAGPPESYALTFVDFALGDPAKENVLVIGGRSKNPQLVNGTLTLNPCIPPAENKLSFAVGGCTLEGPKDQQVPAKIMASPGQVIQVGLWYKSPEDNSTDEAVQHDHIQGLSMGVCFNESFLNCKGTYHLDGTITESVGAEFVNVHCKNGRTATEPAGPRGGELVVGILVDALPPFDGQDLPPTEDYLKLLCVDFEVSASARCGECSALSFCEGAVGGATGPNPVPIRNLVSVMNDSVKPGLLQGGEVCILAGSIFIRGDCNYSDGQPDNHGPVAVDIADAAAVISHLFLTGTWKYYPVCMKACDANDDGRVDLADSVYLLRYLFKFDSQPSAPYPDPGSDPTPDKLTCVAGTACRGEVD